MKIVLIFIGSCLVFLTGCGSRSSDPHVASEQLFRELLTQKQRDRESCLLLASSAGMNSSGLPNIELFREGENEVVRILLDAGFLTFDDSAQTDFSRSTGLQIFSIGPAAEKYIQYFPNQMWPDKQIVGLCPGRIQIDEITFTVPAEGMGQQISNVTYSWHIEEIDGIFEDINSRPNMPNNAQRFSANGQSGHRFVLTNNGWQ